MMYIVYHLGHTSKVNTEETSNAKCMGKMTYWILYIYISKYDSDMFKYIMMK